MTNLSKQQEKLSERETISKIEFLLKNNYKIEPDLIDVKSEIDSTLTFEENWNHIKRKFVYGDLKEESLLNNKI